MAGTSERSGTDPAHGQEDVKRVAGLLDVASQDVSKYRRFETARKLFLATGVSHPTDDPPANDDDDEHDDDHDDHYDHDDHDDHDDDEWDDDDHRAASRLPLVDSAAWAAMRYHVDLIVDGKKERARLEPHFQGPDASDPPDTDDQAPEVVAAWSALAAAVESPAARALLSHLVFQAGAPDARAHARTAATSYLELARSDARAVDSVHSLRVAVRLARAIGDDGLYVDAIHALEDEANACLVGQRQSVGAARTALGSLIRERSSRARELVEIACATFGADQAGQAFWRLKLQTATDETDREQIWRDRVAAATAVAEASSSNILKASRLRDVLALAEGSGVTDLREQAAVLVQGIRNMDLEMMSIRASSHRFDEQFEEMVASILNDPDTGDFTTRWHPDLEVPEADEDEAPRFPTWYMRLRAFAQHGPPTGDPDQNREQITNQHRLAPLQHLFPIHLQTPEGLPLYAPDTEEARFDLDMVKWETQLLEQWTHIYAAALHRVLDPDIPPFNSLVQVLSQGDEPSAIGHQLAESLFRYWAGDEQAALHTTMPMIEALVRDAVLRADRAIFRLQRKQSPGQYVGLGVLLDLFYDIYDVEEKDQRFFNAVLKHPGGWNLRNLLSHGYLAGVSGGVAALALYTALRILVLVGDTEPSNDTDLPEDTEPPDEAE